MVFLLKRTAPFFLKIFVTTDARLPAVRLPGTYAIQARAKVV